MLCPIGEAMALQTHHFLSSYGSGVDPEDRDPRWGGDSGGDMVSRTAGGGEVKLGNKMV